VPLTLEDAVRRAVDNNLEVAVERLNPQTFDFTLASLRRQLQPERDVDPWPARQRAPADEPAESRQPNVSTMTYNAGIQQNVPWVAATTP
jgi:hypothetical protein